MPPLFIDIDTAGKDETLYFLSGKYGIDVVEIENFNPEIKYSELQINQVLKIPKRKKNEEEDRFSVDDL